ncbi:coiled-coil domain-containing protein 93-like [Paramacrobiotus metropolitanus]|uniref:coiled-coil domain-containing protein 93-like n=1 Tax=Paramacrobiotus metropolitanus TaxID=2943436 RepID=UPI002445DBB4|nr:coiled-coil domain-containing protein 93-like [Paramacrobiotus metropolitanus]
MEKMVEVREDEEQSVKLQETMELLVAAGYFRARIKGLHPFDKIVGGMVWCLEVCNLDIDIDLLFQESLSIGQKIALTEKIVKVLPKLQCPHRLDPHQIQGLDFVHIYPVVQWLVKRAIETREETGDTNRAYAIRQFDKHHTTPEDTEQRTIQQTTEQALRNLNNAYAPRRRYRRKAGQTQPDFATKVQYTLLEYGNSLTGINSGTAVMDQAEGKNKSKVAGSEEKKSTTDIENDRLRNMVGEMEQLDDRGRKIKASTIGNIVSQQADEISQLEALHEQQKAELEAMAAEGIFAGFNKPQHMSDLLQSQLETLKAKEQELASKKESLENRIEELKITRKELKAQKETLDSENADLDQNTNNMDTEQLERIAELLVRKTAIEEEIATFRTECKKESARMKTEYRKIKEELENPSPEKNQLSQDLKDRLATERDTLREIRLRLAKRNREVAQLQRRLDDIPSQAELSQYQKRFIELYDQVAVRLRETKKYYTLYNTLSDTKMYYEKEVQLLESIHDNFEVAVASDSAKEQFIRQLEQILDSLRQTVSKAEKRRQTEKLKRDQLNDRYLELLEKQRLYHKLVKEFQQECARNEELIALAEQ